MATKQIAWTTGSGNITLTYQGQGDGTIAVRSDSNNLYEARSVQFTVRTTDGSNIERTITVSQAAKVRTDISTAVVTAPTQTYSGNALTPTPIVTLNGETIPSSGYDVSYSNNTNAGTATITVTGKGEYTGTANGTFAIAKASRTLTFADSYMVLNTSSTGTKTATPSAGSGDGAITYSIANTTYATINSSTGAVTTKTSDGSVIVTATIAAGTNYESASASYTLYVFATTHNYSYSGSAKNVTLPPGTYKLECWGAQGGSNGANSTYGITAKAGGKGGYSVGQLSIANALAIQVLVGGQGSASAAGYNGGGSTTGTSQYNSGNTFGYSKMGGGGGATDIRLSDGALLSRMIVAGGGSGGAMCAKQTQKEVTTWEFVSNKECGTAYTASSYKDWYFSTDDLVNGTTYKIECYQNSTLVEPTLVFYWLTTSTAVNIASTFTFDSSKNTYPARTIRVRISNTINDLTIKVYKQTTTTQTVTTNESHVGYVGGGTNGGGYSSSYYGKQNGAGSGGSFGQGANQTTTNYRYCSGAGGGGWYGGGGGQNSDSTMTYCKYSGGGSGFVNTSASAGNRPSGYTGLQLDSGETKAGNTSFPNTAGTGNETGHRGNGYAKITRIS